MTLGEIRELLESRMKATDARCNFFKAFLLEGDNRCYVEVTVELRPANRDDWHFRVQVDPHLHIGASAPVAQEYVVLMAQAAHLAGWAQRVVDQGTWRAEEIAG